MGFNASDMRNEVRKAVFLIGRFAVKEGSTGGWLVFATNGEYPDANKYDPIAIFETRKEALEFCN